jgi:hypothetical protein
LKEPDIVQYSHWLMNQPLQFPRTTGPFWRETILKKISLIADPLFFVDEEVAKVRQSMK